MAQAGHSSCFAQPVGDAQGGGRGSGPFREVLDKVDASLRPLGIRVDGLQWVRQDREGIVEAEGGVRAGLVPHVVKGGDES